jgi:siroheme synthase (precorrin-2 oxidase/ferrochelatase)
MDYSKVVLDQALSLEMQMAAVVGKGHWALSLVRRLAMTGACVRVSYPRSTATLVLGNNAQVPLFYFGYVRKHLLEETIAGFTLAVRDGCCPSRTLAEEICRVLNEELDQVALTDEGYIDLVQYKLPQYW